MSFTLTNLYNGGSSTKFLWPGYSANMRVLKQLLIITVIFCPLSYNRRKKVVQPK